MKPINSILICIIVILLLSVLFFKKENFTIDNNISEIENKIKSLEFAMSSMKNATHRGTVFTNEKKPYKTVYNYY